MNLGKTLFYYLMIVSTLTFANGNSIIQDSYTDEEIEALRHLNGTWRMSDESFSPNLRDQISSLDFVIRLNMAEVQKNHHERDHDAIVSIYFNGTSEYDSQWCGLEAAERETQYENNSLFDTPHTYGLYLRCRSAREVWGRSSDYKRYTLRVYSNLLKMNRRLVIYNNEACPNMQCEANQAFGGISFSTLNLRQLVGCINYSYHQERRQYRPNEYRDDQFQEDMRGCPGTNQRQSRASYSEAQARQQARTESWQQAYENMESQSNNQMYDQQPLLITQQEDDSNEYGQ